MHEGEFNKIYPLLVALLLFLYFVYISASAINGSNLDRDQGELVLHTNHD